MVYVAPEWAAILPLVVLTLVGAVLPLLGAFRQVRAGVLAGIAALGILASGVLTLAMLWPIPGLAFMPRVGPETAALVSFRLLEMTPFVALFYLVFLAVALMVTVASPRYLARRHQGEYYSLLLLSTVGMMSVAAGRDLITLFVGLELSSFCTYALAAFHKRRIGSAEAGMKYFLVGSISSALALFGISMVYGLTGDTSYEALGRLWSGTVGQGGPTLGSQMVAGHFPLGVFVWGLLLAGFGYKVAIVPFHNYAVDVYDGAPSTVGGFLAAGSKQMGFAALFKVFLLGLFAVKANWDMAVGVIAVVTMVVGNVAALSQTNVKRMLAYSSIAQAGYILMALAIGTPYALAGGLFHILTYSFMQAGAFIALAAAETWGVGATMDDWRGMSKRAPFLAFSMTVFLLSFAGIPPLAGFASKFVLFSSAILAGGWYFWLAVAGILTSAISLVYYWKLIRMMYVEDEPEADRRRLAIASSATLAVAIALAGTILLGILPQIAVDAALDAAGSFLATVQP
jgi:proton-translocating NADH-quinone oxidoreductase chain N